MTAVTVDILKAARLLEDLRDEKSRRVWMEAHGRKLLGHQFRALRLRDDLPQASFARKVGISVDVLRRVESADPAFTKLTTLFGIAEALDLAVSVRFMGWDEFLRQVDTDALRADVLTPRPYNASAIRDALMSGSLRLHMVAREVPP